MYTIGNLLKHVQIAVCAFYVVNNVLIACKGLRGKYFSFPVDKKSYKKSIVHCIHCLKTGRV